jgi:UDP-N-acetylmuramoyl-L-alanyl-D-glutamate--2,6-diaminopimelate ligase
MDLKHIILQAKEKSKNIFDRADYDYLENIDAKGIAYDSRKVSSGFVFFAIKGYKDNGEKYIFDAVRNGAAAVVAPKDTAEKQKINFPDTAFIPVSNIRRAMALVSSVFYGEPENKIKCIGVTGTNGKTTITYLIQHFLQKAGHKCGLIGTINYFSGNETRTSTLTTPDSIEIFSMLDEMVKSGIEYCVMEVSSIALELDRVYGIKFEQGIFTNLTSEHLDLHKNMENYFNAKKILFDNMPKGAIAISNKDDIYGEKIISSQNLTKILYSVVKPSNYQANNIHLGIEGIKFNVSHEGIKYEMNSKLTGRFNVYNILAAIASAVSIGIEIKDLQEYLKDFEPVNGRFNPVKLKNGAYAVIDYSHTSDSLKNAIFAAKEILTPANGRKVITIFGCGGNKDVTKRPVMGKIASEYSDFAIVTSDNPRYEEPMDIIKQILQGMGGKKNYIVDENREDAIKKGIEMSSEGDIILICGKGHETYQEVKGVKSHFDDKEIVEKYNK